MKLGIVGVLVAVLLAALVATLHPQTAEARVGKPAVALMANGDLRISWAKDPYLKLRRYEVQIRDALSPRLVFSKVTDDNATFTVVNRSSLLDEQGKMRVRVRPRLQEARSSTWTVGRWSSWSTPFAFADFVDGWKIKRRANGQLRAKWKSVPNAEQYEIEITCVTHGCADSRTISVPKSQSSATISPQAGMQYRARVRAIKAEGTGPWTVWVYDTSVAALSGITNLSVLRLTDGTINVNWNLVPGAKSYQVAAECTPAGCTVDPLRETEVDEPDLNLPTLPGQTYRVRVRAVGSDGQRAWSDWQLETPVPVLPAISNPRARWEKDWQLFVGWREVKRATKYHVEVECGFAPGSDPACVTDSWEVIAPRDHGYFVPSEVLPGQVYRVRVRAADSHGARAWSSWMPALPAPFLGTIADPQVLRLVNGQLRVTWGSVQRAKGYEVMIECTTAKCTDHQTFTVAGTVTHATVSTSDSAGYRARIRTASRQGTGAWTNWVVEQAPPALAQVVRPSLILQSDFQNFYVRWPHVAGADYYSVEMACGEGIHSTVCTNYHKEIKAFAVAALVPGALLEVTIPGPEKEQGNGPDLLIVRVRVRAADAHGGAGPWSVWSFWSSPRPRYVPVGPSD